MKRSDIIEEIRAVIKKMTPQVEARLYGSEARGDANAHSDIDLLILVDKNTVSVEDELKITEPLYHIELRTGILINPLILPRKLWGKIVTPFYENVMKEGILL